ncbi:hypothetical protein Clacol_000462 [Clathrus columnatus]|uniref:Peptidase A1 domain-containing protein n=1 Tax=Clathrus columnatus TaxID=1419009 RepID=A0AAV4ZWJ8_9AGAM|nr:hypothetical protein Clacol_000462 [Clathrus columnatus]
MRRPRDEEAQSQGDQGVILNLTLSGDGVWNAIYSVQAIVGKAQQTLSFSIDTGSSDLWIASTSCSSSACSGAHTSLYNPASAILTGQTLNLEYLGGSVDGDIVWDSFTLGPYSIPAQAMVSASQVSDELLSSNFVGLLGLALPKNSNIAKWIPPTESDSPDGATFQQNVFGLTPIDTAPAQRFLGISLERPGSSRIPSLLTIGKHPENLIPNFDSSQIKYMDLIPSPIGDTYWRVSLDAITGWIDSIPYPVTLGASTTLTNVDGPVAVIDTGGSIILATRAIANGIYGAWGIGPGSDGNYYIPCETPMNMTISLGNIGPIPIHPLDLTARAPGSEPSLTDTCMGVIQASDQLAGVGDMVLGVAFLRNVYSVLSSDSSNDTDVDSAINEDISPRLGFISLTNPTTALQEFHSVRVLGQSLDPSNNSSPTSAVVVDRSLSVGVIVLFGIIGFFFLCATLFGVRWWMLRSRFKKDSQDPLNWVDQKPKNANETDQVKKITDESKDESSYAESTSWSERTRPELAYIPDQEATPEFQTLPSSLLSALETGEEIQEELSSLPSSDLNRPVVHSRSPSSATASSFKEDFGMAGVGARNSMASATSSKEVRPRIQEDANRSYSQSFSPVMWTGDELGPIVSGDSVES